MITSSPAAASSDLMYRLLVQGVTDYAIYMLDPDGIVANWNAGAERAKGYRAEDIVGQHFRHFYSPADQAAGVPEAGLETARREGRFEAEGWRFRKEGGRFWAHVVIEAIRDEGGALLGFAKITRDRTAQRESAELLRATSANLDLALRHMSQGLCLFDKDEKLVLCNARFLEIFGMEEADCRPGTTLDSIHLHMARNAGGGERTAQIARQLRQNHDTMRNPAAGLTRTELEHHGRILDIAMQALPDGGWVATVEDITARRAIEQRIRHMAHHDPLTDLPNRLLFRRCLEDALAGRNAGRGCAILFLDLDRFKPVNDMLGHAAGDAVLKAVGQRIRAALRRDDIVARMGGDEFAIIQVAPRQPADVSRLAERLLREIARPIEIHGQQVCIGVSIGIAVAPADGTEPDLLLRNADLALYRAKNERRHCYRYYEEGMDAAVLARQQLEQDLRHALAAGEFQLHYQPIMDLNSGRIGSFEALLRWQSESRGAVPPGEFIPFAEETGLISDIGAWVLRTACAEAVNWPKEVKVSVNVSTVQFREGDLVAVVREALDASGLAPERLELEITETAMIENQEATVAILHELRALGISIAMDDFGTGYSSLSFLQSFPFTRIKIDQSFVRDLGQSPQATAIVRAVTGLCKGLGVAATAEGVETEEQQELLRLEHCTSIQGYYISRPQPAHLLPQLLDQFWSAPGKLARACQAGLAELGLS